MRIKIEEVSFYYDSVQALENITLTLESRKITCVIGPNGAGKTTLLKLIASILSPSKGVVYIDGKNIKSYNSQEIAKIIAYSEPHISRNLPMTVLDFLSIARYPYHKLFQYFESTEDLKIIEEVARELDIVHILSRRIDQISSGELQRTIIAYAFIKKPRILLLDEPSAFLDIKHRFEVMNYVKKYTVKENMVTVVALHDLYITSIYCDTIILLDKGRIVACGKPEEVFTNKIIEDVYGVKIDVAKIGESIIVLPKPKLT